MKLVKPVNSIKKSKRVGRGNGSGLGRLQEEVIRAQGKEVVLNIDIGLKEVKCLFIEECQ